MTNLKKHSETIPPRRQKIPHNCYYCRYPTMVKVVLNNFWIQIIIWITIKVEWIVASETSHVKKIVIYRSTTS